jgi:hypothetical protein
MPRHISSGGLAAGSGADAQAIGPLASRRMLELRCIEVSAVSALDTYGSTDVEIRAAIVERTLMLLATLARKARELPSGAEQRHLLAAIDASRRRFRSRIRR